MGKPGFIDAVVVTERRQRLRRTVGRQNPVGAAADSSDRDADGRRDHQGESGRNRRRAELLHDLPDGVLLHRDGRRLLRDLQRVLDHRGTTATRERAAARGRRAATPGVAGDADRVGGRRRGRFAARADRRYRCVHRAEGFLGVLGVDFPSTSLQLLPRTVVLVAVVGTFVTVLSAVAAGPSTGARFSVRGDARVCGRAMSAAAGSGSSPA